jgi:hypothetical protein
MKNQTPYEFSPRLISYAAEIEETTGREVVVSWGTLSPQAWCEFDGRTPDIVDIRLSKDSRTAAEAEHDVAHKIAHARLFFIEKYPSWRAENEAALSPGRVLALQLLESLPKDIVADSVIFDRGFGRRPDLLPIVKQTTAAMKSGREAFRSDLPFGVRALDMANLATYTYGMVYYSEAFQREAGAIGFWYTLLRKHYPREWKYIRPCQVAVTENDIFTAEGYAAAFRAILGVFGISAEADS